MTDLPQAVEHQAPRHSVGAKAVIRLIRPRQWVKNGFALLPVIFAEKWTDPHAVVLAILCTIAFTGLSVAIYCINDVMDAEFDRKHPRKRSRPVAAGLIAPRTALMIGAIATMIGLLIGAFLGPWTFLILGAYLLTNIAYCLGLKHQPLLDVMIVASGFLFRAVGGAFAIGVIPSPWLLTCTTFLALLLVLVKRRQEVARTPEGSASARKVLEHYPLPLLDQLIAGMVPTSLLTYMLYCFTVHPPIFLITSTFVAYGLFRYLYLVHAREAGEQPEEVLLTDVPTLINVVLWAACSAALIVWT